MRAFVEVFKKGFIVSLSCGVALILVGIIIAVTAGRLQDTEGLLVVVPVVVGVIGCGLSAVFGLAWLVARSLPESDSYPEDSSGYSLQGYARLSVVTWGVVLVLALAAYIGQHYAFKGPAGLLVPLIPFFTLISIVLLGNLAFKRGLEEGEHGIRWLNIALAVVFFPAVTVALRSADGSFVRLPMMFSSDASTFASLRENDKVALWDLKTGRALPSFDVSGFRVLSLAFSRNGRRLLVSGEQKGSRGEQVRLWDVDAGREIITDAPRDSNQVQISPNGESYLLRSPLGNEVRSSSDGKVLLAPGSGSKYPLYSDDGRFLTDRKGGVVSIWGIAGEWRPSVVKFKCDQMEKMAATELAPGGGIVAGFIEGDFRHKERSRWEFKDVSTGEEILTVAGLRRLKFSPDGKWAVLWEGCGTTATDRVEVWDLVKREMAGSSLMGNYVSHVHFSPDASRAGVIYLHSGHGYILRVWNLLTGETLDVVPPEVMINSVQWCSYAPWVAVVSKDDGEESAPIGSVHNLMKGEERFRMENIVFFSPDGKAAVLQKKGRLSVIEVPSGKKLIDIR